MKTLKEICNVNIPNSLHSLFEASILDIDGTIEDGNKQIKKPQIALNVKCKDFKDIVEMFADYFGETTPKIKKMSNLQWRLNYSITQCYSNIDYVKFDLSNPNIGTYIFEIINAGIKNKYPVFRVTKDYTIGAVHNKTFSYVFGEKDSLYDNFEYGKTKFYECLPIAFKNLLEFNQNKD